MSGGGDMDNAEKSGEFRIEKLDGRLKGYKFNCASSFYEYLLAHGCPKEATVITKALSKTSLHNLKCVSIVFREEKRKNPKEDLEVTVVHAKLLSRLIYGVQGDKKLEKQAKQSLIRILKLLTPARLLELSCLLYEVDKNMVCLGTLYQLLLIENGDILTETDGDKTVQAVVELYLKEFLLTKVPKTPWVVQNVATNLMACLRDKSGCVDTILSAISKALVRSPETSIEAVGYTLQALKPALRENSAVDLAKRIGACLSTENEKQKMQAVFASQALFSGITEDNVRQATLNEFFELVSPAAKGTKSTLTSGAKITVLTVNIKNNLKSDTRNFI